MDLRGAWAPVSSDGRAACLECKSSTPGHMRLATLGTGIGPLKCEASARCGGGGERGAELPSRWETGEVPFPGAEGHQAVPLDSSAKPRIGKGRSGFASSLTGMGEGDVAEVVSKGSGREM